MAREMTPQERAAIQSFYYSLHAGVEGGEFQERYEQEDIGRIIELLDETRRAALLEVAEEIERFIDYSGGCVGTENDPRVVAVNRFITISIVPLLNRLAQEGA